MATCSVVKLPGCWCSIVSMLFSSSLVITPMKCLYRMVLSKHFNASMSLVQIGTSSLKSFNHLKVADHGDCWPQHKASTKRVGKRFFQLKWRPVGKFAWIKLSSPGILIIHGTEAEKRSVQISIHSGNMQDPWGVQIFTCMQWLISYGQTGTPIRIVPWMHALKLRNLKQGRPEWWSDAWQRNLYEILPEGKTLRIQVCPRKGFSLTFLLGWNWSLRSWFFWWHGGFDDILGPEKLLSCELKLITVLNHHLREVPNKDFQWNTGSCS